MSTVLSSRHGHYIPTMAAPEFVSPTQGPTPPEIFKLEDELGARSAKPKPGAEEHAAADDDPLEYGDDNNSSNTEGGANRKRRRSRKGLDKKFDCPHEGCGKSYSRAEHLYRHQLNHNPKQIFKCDFPECDRQFVRLDLCNRHKERHTAKGSALSRRDSLVGASHTADGRYTLPPGSLSPEANRQGNTFARPSAHSQLQDVCRSSYTPVADVSQAFPHPNGAHGSAGCFMQPDSSNGHMQGRHPPQRTSTRQPRPSAQTTFAPYGALSPSSQHEFQSQSNTNPQSAAPYAAGQANFPPFALAPSNFPSPAQSSQVSRDGGQGGFDAQQTVSEHFPSQGQRADEMALLDSMTTQTTIPVFGSDSVLSKSPYVGMPEDFMAYLFNTGAETGSLNSMIPQYNITPYYGLETSQMGFFPTSGPQHVMAVNNLVDQSLPESVISDNKSAEVFQFIKQRFHDIDRAPVDHKRTILVEEERNDHHMLSRKMMQAYIGSYWAHFSDQIPILHKPTFSPDRAPTLLLISVMAIGAACLDKAYGPKVIRAGVELSNFLAWHLRWETFMDSSFRPPARLWVFQTLILLELYEKMYSSRELHERAHIHHATTITLMRRGRSLIGKSALDSPPTSKDNGSRRFPTSGGAHTPDDWWNYWITNEATRRAAFAAFVVDSIHATMFGHSTVMVAHEMRLPLPCDEQLWRATSGAEVGRIESNLMSNGFKPVSFLEGLKRTLSCQKVQTNSFGRMVIMAGLLNVSWHMNQRDLQVNSLGTGVSSVLGPRDKWRATLTRAFDSWKHDFDKSLKKTENPSDPYAFNSPERFDTSTVLESRVILHHLAHMAMHVDIVDCQIFARAKRLLGRAIGPQDLSSAQRRMKDIWAPSVRARDATWYALRFLYSVLVDGRGHVRHPPSPPPPPQQQQHGQYNHPNKPIEIPYSARDDVLLNRPWVLYFSALVVWSYGHALEGPCPEVTVPTSKAEQARWMRDYLVMYGGTDNPEILRTMRGVNNNSALLLVLKDSFMTARWELLHEGATLLNNCISLNAGKVL